MDLFVLDRLVVAFFQRLMTDPMVQFGVMTGIGILVSAIFPERGDKK